jgi:hypothetical protein
MEFVCQKCKKKECVGVLNVIFCNGTSDEGSE